MQNTGINKENNLINSFVEKSLLLLSTIVTTSEGLKALAKITKSSTEAIRKIQECYFNGASPLAINFNQVAANLNGVLTLFEPILIMKELILGDKEGQHPWNHFKEFSSSHKGLSWIFKKTAASIEFAKYIHNLQAINIASTIFRLNVLKSICDIGFATITMIDKGLTIQKAEITILKLKEKQLKWINRKRDWLTNNQDGNYNLEAIKATCYLKLLIKDRKNLTADMFKQESAEPVFQNYIRSLGGEPLSPFTSLVKQVEDTLFVYLTSVEEKMPIELSHLMESLPEIKMFIQDNQKFHHRHIKWKTLNVYVNFESHKVSAERKMRRFEKYCADQIKRFENKIENQKCIKLKSTIMIAFSVGLFALGVLSFIGLVAPFAAWSTLLISVAVISNTIGLIRFSSEVMLKVKKEHEFKAVELPYIRQLYIF